jgi:hypothetical protein
MGNSIEDYRAAIGLFHIRIKETVDLLEENIIRVDCYNLYQKKKKIKSIIIPKKNGIFAGNSSLG